LHTFIDADKYEALCVQQKIVRLNGVYALDLIKSLVGTVEELGEYVIQRKGDNTASS
jgi:hypothetical protein